ncbi:MAG: DUF4384 domain-containing protein [Blastocatellia bacterium]
MKKFHTYLPPFCAVFFCAAVSVFAQQPGTRDIFPEEFVRARPGKPAATARKPVYRPAEAKTTTAPKTTAPAGYQQLGMTVWRLRRARNTDTAVRIIVQGDAESAEWVPERIEANTPLNMGERIRFSFEAQQTGYLYVIDREQYADGSVGDPHLIFPTTRTRNGDNQVSAGRIIEIPGQDDRPNFFTMRHSREDQTGEMLTVIVAPQPLAGVTIGEKSLRLTNEQVAQWEKTWGARVERFEMADGAGKSWTKAEQEAGANATRQLTQDDPGPQTVYRVATNPDAPLLVRVGLRYRRR